MGSEMCIRDRSCAVDEENLILLGSSKKTKLMTIKVVGVKDQAEKRRA